jgi:hypothetical protein
MTRFLIVNTDNFAGDYPNEKFVENLPPLFRKEQAETICKAINSVQHAEAPRYFKVVEEGYELQPGFKP